MMIEELIRYAINGMAMDDNLTQRDFVSKTQSLIDILINFPKDTDKNLYDIIQYYETK